MTRVLVLGANGMLGNAVLRLLADSPGVEAIGTTRSPRASALLPTGLQQHTRGNVDVENFDSLTACFADTQPDIVVNCIGVVKQLAEADDPLYALPINSVLPHRLARLSAIRGARLIHVSTDCVFSGRKGGYVESDYADADDLYGRTKYLGEVQNAANAVTLRTSIIGHELAGARSLLCWFLAQEKTVKGFTKAVFSGLPTVELARVIRDHVIPNPALQGLYHVATDPIDKFQLLTLVKQIYGRSVDIIPDAHLVIDRSLDATRFNTATGYSPPAWVELIKTMHSFG